MFCTFDLQNISLAGLRFHLRRNRRTRSVDSLKYVIANKYEKIALKEEV